MPAALVIFLLAAPLGAQVAPPASAEGRSSATPPGNPNRKSPAWRIKPAGAGVVEYDDNVFLLKDSRQDDLGSPSAAELQSGRYTDMESAFDAIASLEGAVRIRGSGLAGRDLDIVPSAELELHTLNRARTNAVMGLTVVQDLARGGRLRGRAAIAPASFRRNYLVGVDDANGDGWIEPAERRYAAGEAGELEVGADYRHRIRKSTKASPLEAAAQVGAGFTRQSYAAPFGGRDHAGPMVDARLLLELTERVGVDFGYGVAMLEATPTSEVMLVTDGTGRRAATGIVDRSRTEHVLGAQARLAVTRRTDVALEFERRQRTYTSAEPTDVRYRGRRDARNGVGAELTSRLGGGLRTVARVQFARQNLTRGGGTGGEEVDDYTRLRAAVGLRYDF